ncbi:MAG: rod shape-determining protein [Candidatus Harrisonbacteria bacterium RIFCSPLOWO2_02_FULL_45_10c]|uniref:Cell shape-determining protein MreB n=1 Tax=Candidatus Harrisonbacteria bacterium RIFCSPLOWO2_02_FULL_45_10c TaxID=1798410 RepID=A0A1G1ZT36_9BACT|nr:MAG: rod shape-determining protein [Candidatus Harrisonbacteria bacterium RIFCSPLOWO2_02_FULL_45_10c]
MNYFSKHIGVDLGTANSLVYVSGRGIVINEPSIAAVNNKTGAILAIGEEAKKMVGRTPAHITIIRPLINGVISDFEMTQEMLKYFFKKIRAVNSFFHYHRAVIGVPSNLTEVERKSVEDAVIGAGVSKAYVIEEPLAAALGARLPISEPTASMVVDIGGGTTEIAIISMGGIVTSKSLKVAGDRLNEDIIRFVRDEFKLAIGEPTSEELKVVLGSAVPIDQKMELAIRGRDMATGLPKEVVLKEPSVRVAMARSLKLVTESIREVIETTPPELVGDILKNGIHMCGGGSLLRGLDKLFERELLVPVKMIDDPLTAVARGTGIAVEQFDKYYQVVNNPLRPRDIKI